jgi:hypothetical protein|tara:strand:- start:1111 stop:1497 length:387 start_codon:yes stop_codon:yes gene_type:complete
MATKTITFDPDSGVPYGLNLTMYGGSDFAVNINVKTTSNGNFDLTDYSGSAAMSKSVAVGATLGITSSFTVGFTSAYDGQMKISLGSTDTRGTTEGRYMYDILVSSGSTTYTLANGNIYVYNPVSSAP